MQKSNHYSIIAQLGETKVKLGGSDFYKMWQLLHSLWDWYRNLDGIDMGDLGKFRNLGETDSKT